MLQLILGRAGSGKTTELYRRIRQVAEAGGQAILLVPEQFSFENERELYLRLGPELSSRVEVLGFGRLCDNIFRYYGGLAGRALDDTARRILMGVTLQEMGSGLEVYAAQADKPGFIEDMIGEIGEFKAAGITPDRLLGLSLPGNPSLSEKVGDIGQIYAAYQALIDRSYLDGEDDLIRAVQMLSPREFFGGISVFIDSFTAFMEAEYQMLGAMLAGASDVTAAFTCDSLDDPDQGLGVFSASKESAARLVQMAGESAVPVAEPLLMGEPVRFRAEGLRRMEQYFLRPTTAGEPAGEGVTLVSAADPYEEIAAVAASICDDVRRRGLRYREIAVICRDLTPYRIALERTFAKYGIPFFADLPQGAMDTPAVSVVRAALDCAAEGFSAGNILRFAKAAAVGITPEEAAELENYCYVWNVGRRDWQKPFENHPDGFQADFSSEDTARLERINGVRRRVIRPLEQFRQGLREADGPGFSTAVCQLLESIGAAEHIEALCRAAEPEEERLRMIEEQDRVWEELMKLLDTLAVVIGPRRLPLRVLESLFDSGASAIRIGEIPQTLDQVIVGTADRIRPTGIRSAYVIGASAGVFPAACGSVGLFGENERTQLISAGLQLSQTARVQAVREKFYAYFAVTVPSERLWISWPAAGLDGGSNPPSQIITEAAALTGTEPQSPVQLAPAGAVNRAVAMEQLAAGVGSPEYRSALQAALDSGFSLQEHTSAAESYRAVLSDLGLARRLFGDDMILSATRLEKFYGCPYSYFCRYGLGLTPRTRAELSPLELGNVIHLALEQLLQKYTPEQLREMEDSVLRREIRSIADGSLSARTQDQEALPKRFFYLYGRMVDQIFRLVRMLAQELCQSEFRPLRFEYPIGEQESTRPLQLATDSGDMVRVEGKVDRVDCYHGSSQDYIRVIDYKTGGKKFDLSEVVQGLNMQMLLYLFTLGENGVETLAAPGEAGVLYMPGSGHFTRGRRDTSDDSIAADQQKSYCMSGIVLEDTEVIEAMELGTAGRYIPVSLKKDGSYTATSSLITEEQLRLLRRQIAGNVVQMAELLHRGRIGAVPANRNGRLPCEYCDYRAVCGREIQWPDRPVVKLEKAEIYEQLEGGQLAWQM